MRLPVFLPYDIRHWAAGIVSASSPHAARPVRGLAERFIYVSRYLFLLEMANILATTYILRRLADFGAYAFNPAEFRRLFDLRSSRAYQVLHRLETQGVIRRLAQGRYVVVGLGEADAMGEPFFLGTRLVEPSYASFWSALHFYGWTEQAPRVIFLANTRGSGRRRVRPYEFWLVKFRPSRFFGYVLARRGVHEFPIAEPEKALLDSLFLPSYAGGMDEVAKALGEASGTLDRERLESYARAMGSRSLASRLGHLLERTGVPSTALLGAASAVYVKLDPSGPRRGRCDARWKVIDNLGAVA